MACEHCSSAGTHKERIIKIEEVVFLTGLSKSTIERRESQGTFPVRIDRGGGGMSGWFESEIFEWIKSRPRKATRHRVEGGQD